MSETLPAIQQGELDLDPVVAARCEDRLKIARTHTLFEHRPVQDHP